MTRYLEDIEIGETREYGAYTITESDLVAFAKRYDPQPFHVDRDAARETPPGHLIASGWQTACIAMRLAVLEGYLRDVAIVTGVGIDALRWTESVYPGDTLTVREEMLDKRPSESDPSRGVLRIEITVVTADDREVLTMEWIDLVKRRPGAADE
jgi:acyl dehydratase